MKYRIFQYGRDNAYIKDVVKGHASREDNVEPQSETWFRQRFEQNPLGKAILACAFDGERMVACMIVERVPIECESQHTVGGYVSEYFVLPDYESPELLAELLKLVEEEAKNSGLDILLTYNVIHVKDFGWTYFENKVRFRLNSVSGLWRSLFKLLDSTKPFVPDNREIQYDGTVIEKENESEDVAVQKSTKAYYKWLSQTGANKYITIDDEEFYAVAIIGQRGKRVREAHICYLESKRGDSFGQHVLEVIKEQYKKECIDVVSWIDDMHYLPINNSLRISQMISYCYKSLGDGEHNMSGIVLDYYAF